MVNKDFGWIGNAEGTKEVPIKVVFPNKIDFGVLVGLGLVEAGLIFLGSRNITKFIVSSIIVNTGILVALHETFYRGANQFYKGETQALIDAGVLKGNIEDFIF